MTVSTLVSVATTEKQTVHQGMRPSPTKYSFADFCASRQPQPDRGDRDQVDDDHHEVELAHGASAPSHVIAGTGHASRWCPRPGDRNHTRTSRHSHEEKPAQLPVMAPGFVRGGWTGLFHRFVTPSRDGLVARSGCVILPLL